MTDVGFTSICNSICNSLTNLRHLELRLNTNLVTNEALEAFANPLKTISSTIEHLVFDIRYAKSSYSNEKWKDVSLTSLSHAFDMFFPKLNLFDFSFNVGRDLTEKEVISLFSVIHQKMHNLKHLIIYLKYNETSKPAIQTLTKMLDDQAKHEKFCISFGQEYEMREDCVDILSNTIATGLPNLRELEIKLPQSIPPTLSAFEVIKTALKSRRNQVKKAEIAGNYYYF